jgi:GNAT superfamily N-acetyltransferase
MWRHAHLPRWVMTIESIVRTATADDEAGIVAVAMAEGFRGRDTAVDPTYRQVVATHGQLSVAIVDGAVVGFGGAIDVDGSRMVTDLFVLEQHHGHAIGQALLRHLVSPTIERMTFSSAHPAARLSYYRAGMEPRWRLQYWLGAAPATSAAGCRVSIVERAQWRGDRPELADLWSTADDRLVHLIADGRLVGWAMVVATGVPEARWTIARLMTELPHQTAMRAVLSVVPAGDTVLVSSPEWSDAGRLLAAVGFEQIEHDMFCSTEGLDLDRTHVAVHPGLA